MIDNRSNAKEQQMSLKPGQRVTILPEGIRGTFVGYTTTTTVGRRTRVHSVAAVKVGARRMYTVPLGLVK
jgi:hypothetical protein